MRLDSFLFVIKITKSKKVLMEDGPRGVYKVERSVAYDFFSLTYIPIPLHLIVEENEKDLTVKSFSRKNQHLCFVPNSAY